MIRSITILSSMATRDILTLLAARYEQKHRRPVDLTSIGGVDAAKRIRAGDAMDVVVLASKVMRELDTKGFFVAPGPVAIARSGIAIAIRRGMPVPEIDCERNVRRAIVEAKSIAYSTGPSGDHLKYLLRRWNLGAEVAEALVQAPPGVSVGSLLAAGQADLGLQQLSELIATSGVDVIGPLPAEIQSTTIFEASVCRNSSNVMDAMALLDFLASPESADAKRDYGMQPA